MKILEIHGNTYRCIPVDDHIVVVDENDFGMVSVQNIADAEDKLRRHLEWCTAHEEGVI